VLEAKRRLYYSESTSVKELAYALGFNDPEYFSRLFRNVTGQTVTMFLQDLSGTQAVLSSPLTMAGQTFVLTKSNTNDEQNSW
jgi:AraC-like DNA-binding protein